MTLRKDKIQSLIKQEYKLAAHRARKLSCTALHEKQYEKYCPRNPHPKHYRVLRKALETMPNNGAYLDVCVGAGIVARILSKHGYNVSVIESTQIAGEWKRSFDNEDITLIDIAIEGEKIPLENNSINFIYFGATLEHLQNSPRPVFEEFYRVLKPEGTLFVDVPNFLCLRHRVLMLVGVNVLPSIEYIYNCDFHAEHHREYTLEELIKVFRWSGFVIKETYYDDVTFQRSLVKKGKLAHNRGSGKDYYNTASIWDYNLPFSWLSWFDWAKLVLRPLVKVFPKLRDDVVVVGCKNANS